MWLVLEFNRCYNKMEMSLFQNKFFFSFFAHAKMVGRFLFDFFLFPFLLFVSARNLSSIFLMLFCIRGC